VTSATPLAARATLRLAVVGKGGAGKSTLTASIVRTLARRGRRVLLLDPDSMPGVSMSLGLQDADKSLLNDAMERGENRRVRWVEGLDPISAVQRFAIDGPDGIRVLQFAKSTVAGPAAAQPSVNAFFDICSKIENAPEFLDWSIVGDIPAGGRQPGQGWTPYATHYLLVAEATIQSMMTARRVKLLAPQLRPDARVLLVVSKAEGPADVERVTEYLGLPALGVVPLDEDVQVAERLGVPVFEHAPESAAVAAMQEIAERLDALAPAASAGGDV
jgi:CO dehydrogenase maturation factor